MGDLDADRRIEQHASKMIGTAGAGRTEVQLVLVRLRVGNELL